MQKQTAVSGSKCGARIRICFRAFGRSPVLGVDRFLRAATPESGTIKRRVAENAESINSTQLRTLSALSATLHFEVELRPLCQRLTAFGLLVTIGVVNRWAAIKFVDQV